METKKIVIGILVATLVIIIIVLIVYFTSDDAASTAVTVAADAAAVANAADVAVVANEIYPTSNPEAHKENDSPAIFEPDHATENTQAMLPTAIVPNTSNGSKMFGYGKGSWPLVPSEAIMLGEELQATQQECHDSCLKDPECNMITRFTYNTPKPCRKYTNKIDRSRVRTNIPYWEGELMVKV